MRIDKYLWCIRLAKTRSLAAEWIKKESVTINGELCKASRSVKVGDVIGLRRSGIKNEYKVLGIPRSRVGAAKLIDLLIDVTAPEEIEKQDFLKMMQSLNRQKGMGRPTKKERRDIDRFSGG